MTGGPAVLIASADAHRLAGISYRQLDYWCRAGVIEPAAVVGTWGAPAGEADRSAPGSGRRRLFTRHQVAVLAACGQLARLCADIPALTALAHAVEDVALPVVVAVDVDGVAHVDPGDVGRLGACWVVEVAPVVASSGPEVVGIRSRACMAAS